MSHPVKRSMCNETSIIVIPPKEVPSYTDKETHQSKGQSDYYLNITYD